MGIMNRFPNIRDWRMFYHRDTERYYMVDPQDPEHQYTIYGIKTAFPYIRVGRQNIELSATQYEKLFKFMRNPWIPADED